MQVIGNLTLYCMLVKGPTTNQEKRPSSKISLTNVFRSRRELLFSKILCSQIKNAQISVLQLVEPYNIGSTIAVFEKSSAGDNISLSSFAAAFRLA